MAGRMFISHWWRDILQRHNLDSVETVWISKCGEVIKSAPSTEVRRIELGEGNAQRIIFVKKYWVSKPAQLWSGLFRGTFFGRTKVLREFTHLAQLRDWGIPTPDPVAWGELRRRGFVVRSFLITESVPGPVVSLDRFIRDELPRLTPAEARVRRRELIKRLAEATHRLHQHRFGHGDLYWRNIILAHGGRLDAFYLIDAHASRYWSGAGRSERAQDLATLDAPAPWFFSRTDRLRFLLYYLDRTRIDSEVRQMALRILAAARPIRQRQLKRVQQLRG